MFPATDFFVFVFTTQQIAFVTTARRGSMMSNTRTNEHAMRRYRSRLLAYGIPRARDAFRSRLGFTTLLFSSKVTTLVLYNSTRFFREITIFSFRPAVPQRLLFVRNYFIVQNYFWNEFRNATEIVYEISIQDTIRSFAQRISVDIVFRKYFKYWNESLRY